MPSATTNLNINQYLQSQFVDVNGGGCVDLVLGGDHTTQSAARLNFVEDTGYWIQFLRLIDTTGSCYLDVVPEFGYGRETRIYRNDGTGHFARATTGLPNLFSNPSPIDLDGSGRQGFVSLGGDGYYAVPVANGGKCADNVAAVLPTSRTVQTGKTATAFATIINPAGAAALDCSLGIWGSPVGGFSYSATNSTTNAVVGPLNPTLDIPAGQAQSYVFAISPTAALAEQDVKLRAACANHRPVAPVVGLNTLSFAATSTPTADIIALGATATGDGILHLGGINVPGAFPAASVNIGAAATLSVSVDTGATALPLTLSVCQTNPQSGACLSPAAQSVNVGFQTNATPTFAIFATASQTVAFDPANSRIFLRFRDLSGNLKGASSVAVRTP